MNFDKFEEKVKEYKEITEEVLSDNLFLNFISIQTSIPNYDGYFFIELDDEIVMLPYIQRKSKTGRILSIASHKELRKCEKEEIKILDKKAKEIKEKISFIEAMVNRLET